MATIIIRAMVKYKGNDLIADELIADKPSVFADIIYKTMHI